MDNLSVSLYMYLQIALEGSLQGSVIESLLYLNFWPNIPSFSFLNTREKVSPHLRTRILSVGT